MGGKVITKERVLWMDVLNVVATIGVVLLHCSNDTVHHWDGVFNLAYIWGMITHTVVLWPVCIFLMLSGANLIGYNCSQGGWKTFYVRRFKRVGIPFIVWSLFYAAVFVIRQHGCPDLKWQEYITMFINGKFNGHMWFFVPLFALYLTIPFFNAFLKGASNGVVRWMAYFAFVFCSLLPFVFALFNIGYFNYAIFPVGGSLLIYGYMGYVLTRTELFTDTKLYYGLAICSVIIHFFGMIVVMNVFNFSETLFTSYAYPTCFFMSIGVFLWFKERDWQKFINKIHLSPESLQKLSSCSFGIYLLHWFVIYCIRHLHLGLDNRYYGFIVVYLISLVCVIVMKKIPVIKNMVP